MSTGDGGVRVGPISLFTLVATIGMAVLAVLTISTARAMSTLSRRSVTMMVESYQAEACAQTLLGGIDGELGVARRRGDGYDVAMQSLSTGIDDLVDEAAGTAGEQRDGSAEVTGEGRVDGDAVVAGFETASGRRLDVRIVINRDMTYTIVEWKATSRAGSAKAEEHLWSGEPS